MIAAMLRSADVDALIPRAIIQALIPGVLALSRRIDVAGGPWCDLDAFYADASLCSLGTDDDLVWCQPPLRRPLNLPADGHAKSPRTAIRIPHGRSSPSPRGSTRSRFPPGIDGVAKTPINTKEEHLMLPKEKQMEVLEAFDLTKSYRAAGQLVGVDHHTVARAVAARSLGHSEWGTVPAADGGRGVLRQDHRVDRALRWSGPGRCRPRQARGHGLHRLAPHHQAGGLGVEGRLTGSGTTASTSPGSPSRACGCNTTSAPGR